ncbi:hypothetical protein ILUMI_25092, partial [Ignelater luminosus]
VYFSKLFYVKRVIDFYLEAMKILIFLVTITWCSTSAHFVGITEDEAAAFESFIILNWSPDYLNDKVRHIRQLIFVEHLRNIEAHNIQYQEGKSSYLLDLNSHSDKLSIELPKGVNWYEKNEHGQKHHHEDHSRHHLHPY